MDRKETKALKKGTWELSEGFWVNWEVKEGELILEMNLDGYNVYEWVEVENVIYLAGFGSEIMDGADTLLCYYEFLYSPDEEEFS